MNTSKYNFHFRQIIFLALALGTAMCGSGQKVYKVSVEVDAVYLHVNQPFSIVFSTGSTPFAPAEARMRALAPDSTDFIIVGRGTTNSSISFFNGVQTCSNEYAYTLLPRHSGNLVIKGLSFQYDENAVFSYDTLHFYVSPDRISAADSVQKLAQAKKATPLTKDFQSTTNQSLGSFHGFDDFFSSTITPVRPDGIHYNYADSVYHVKKDRPFHVLYSLSFVNVPGMDKADLDMAYAKDFVCPKNMEVKSTNNITGSTSRYESNYTEFTKEHVVTLVAIKKGTYKIPPLTFMYKGEKYMSPVVKVVVSED